jgi:hypothetical protein
LLYNFTGKEKEEEYRRKKTSRVQNSRTENGLILNIEREKGKILQIALAFQSPPNLFLLFYTYKF